MAIDGTYNIQIETPMGAQAATLILKTDGTALSGSMASDMVGTTEFSGGTVDGDAVAWQIAINSPMGEVNLEFKGQISSDEISGEVVLGSFGTAPFGGKRA